MNQPPAPFSCTYNPQLPELLNQLGCTILISTYQAGKVICLSAVDDNKLVQLPRNFQKPMGIALSDDGQKIAIATKDNIQITKNSKQLAEFYPNQPNTYDALYMPRATYYTGQVDIHDLHWGDAGLWAVNTSFSALCLINEEYSFEPKWQPKFITKLASDDRCHLNGLAMVNGKPKYISALGTKDAGGSWRKSITNGGVLIDIDANENVLENLPMPHAPRWHDNNLYLCLSATGQIAVADLRKGTYSVFNKLNGFIRGMAIYGDYMFVGLSKLRQNSSTFKHLEIALTANESGIVIFHIPTAAKVGQVSYQASVDEIYDIQILPNTRRPNILNAEKEAYKLGLSIPGKTFWSAPKKEA